MKFSRTAALMAAALVVGIVAGNVTMGVAVPSADTTTTGTVTGLGLRLGAALRDAGGRLADVVASLTGLSVDEVHDQREAGTSFAAIAQSKGVDSAKVVEEALKVRAQILDQKVADGTITREQADAALERMKARVTERVAATGEPARGNGRAGGARDGSGGPGMGPRDGSGGPGTGARDGSGGGRGRGMGRGMNGGVCTQAPSDTR